MGRLNKKIIIIGSGIGGLCCGIRLLALGYKVELYEKERTCGGVCKRKNNNEYNVYYDSYASIGIEPQEYKSIYYDTGLNPNKYFNQIDIPILYKIFTYDNKSYMLYKKNNSKNNNIIKDNIEKYSILNNYYMDKYNFINKYYLKNTFVNFSDIYNYNNISNLIKLHPFRKVQSKLKNYNMTDNLKKFLEFQTIYMGLGPNKLSNIYLTIPAITQAHGLFYSEGGMGAYIKGLIKAFKDLGGIINLNNKVNKIITHKNKAIGIKNTNGIKYSDIIICNTDYKYTLKELLDNKYNNLYSFYQNKKTKMSCSVFVLRIGLSTILKNLNIHNIYLSENFNYEINAFTSGIFPKYPPIYIYYPASIDKSLIFNNKTIVNMIIRVPNLSFNNITWDKTTRDNLTQKCINILTNITKTNIEKYILFKSINTPIDLYKNYNYDKGAAFSIAPTLNQSIIFRPQSKSNKIKNLYFVGSSIHPGNGISMVMKCAKNTVELIQRDITYN